MDENERFRLLFGPYAAPQFEYGQIIHCELHGDVIACGLSAGPIPWAIGKYSERGNTRFFIFTGDLVRAVRQEAAIVVCRGGA